MNHQLQRTMDATDTPHDCLMQLHSAVVIIAELTESSRIARNSDLQTQIGNAIADLHFCSSALEHLCWHAQRAMERSAQPRIRLKRMQSIQGEDTLAISRIDELTLASREQGVN